MKGPRHRAGSERNHPMIHGVHHQTVQVDEVAGHAQFRDLPGTVHEHDIPGGEAVEDQGAESGR